MPRRRRYDRLATLRAEIQTTLPKAGFERRYQEAEEEYWQKATDDVVVTAVAHAGGQRLDFFTVSLTFYWVTRDEWQSLDVTEPWPPRQPLEYWQFRGLRDRMEYATTYHGPPQFAVEPNLADDEAEHWRIGVPQALDRLRRRLDDVAHAGAASRGEQS